MSDWRILKSTTTLLIYIRTVRKEMWFLFYWVLSDLSDNNLAEVIKTLDWAGFTNNYIHRVRNPYSRSLYVVIVSYSSERTTEQHTWRH